MTAELDSCDVCIVGGGPGGATVATLVAMMGYRVVLLEQSTYPIYKIGESLLPSTVHGVCRMLGVSDELERAKFVRKQGGTFRWGRNPEPWTFAFAESSRFRGPSSYAYQVERIKFDTILIDNARRKGVDVREGHRVLDLRVDGDRVAGVSYIDRSGRQAAIRSRYVVDAAGHSSPLVGRIAERVYSEFFQNVAVFGYYTGGQRLPEPRSGNIFCAAFDLGWFWYIPLSDALTSVGAVIGKEHANVLQQGAEPALTALVAKCPAIHSLLTTADRATGAPYDEVRIRTDYSYSQARFWRPGMVAIGDAACFIDPVFSSGVHLATYSALLAARSINSCLAGLVGEERAFGEFEARYRREYRYFYDFLRSFYEMDQDRDSYFWAARRAMSSEQPAEEAFIRLVGGIGSDEAVYCSAAERSEIIEQLFTAGAQPGAGDTSAAAPTARRSAFWQNLNAEGINLQMRSAMKTAAPVEAPLFENGLVPSRDGLHWIEPAVHAGPRSARDGGTATDREGVTTA